MANYNSSHTGAQIDAAIDKSLGLGYANCSDSGVTKTANIANFVLGSGACITIKFTYAVPANATLNVTSTGAKAIYYRGAAIIADIIKAGDIATLIYDGTNYNLISSGAVVNVDTANNIIKFS